MRTLVALLVCSILAITAAQSNAACKKPCKPSCPAVRETAPSPAPSNTPAAPVCKCPGDCCLVDQAEALESQAGAIAELAHRLRLLEQTPFELTIPAGPAGERGADGKAGPPGPAGPPAERSWFAILAGLFGTASFLMNLARWFYGEPACVLCLDPWDEDEEDDDDFTPHGDRD